jgi:hypothetical protein
MMLLENLGNITYQRTTPEILKRIMSIGHHRLKELLRTIMGRIHYIIHSTPQHMVKGICLYKDANRRRIYCTGCRNRFNAGNVT